MGRYSNFVLLLEFGDGVQCGAGKKIGDVT